MQPVFRKIANCVRIEYPMISVHFIIEYLTYMTHYSILFLCAVGVRSIRKLFSFRMAILLVIERDVQEMVLSEA